MKRYEEVKFTPFQRIYFKQLLEDVVSSCDKDCYSQYYDFLQSSLQSIVAGSSKVIEIEDEKNGQVENECRGFNMKSIELTDEEVSLLCEVLDTDAKASFSLMRTELSSVHACHLAERIVMCNKLIGSLKK